MDDMAIRELLRRHGSDIENQDRVHEIFRDDVVLEFPQGNERLVGLANVRGMREAYPATVRPSSNACAATAISGLPN
jgi:hypothetical protein